MRYTDEEKLFELFLRTCETGSLAKASILLGYSRATASRQLAQLERKIGKTLLLRGTKGIELTAEALKLRPRIEELLTQLQLLRHVKDVNLEANSTIRISAPTAIGHSLLIPWITSFLNKHSDVTIDITHSMGPVRVMPVGCDIRITHSLFSCDRVITRPLGEMLRMMVASPKFLAKHGCPKHPEDLVNYSLLGGNDLLNGNPLIVIRGQERVVVPYLPRLRLHDHVAAREAAIAGMGIAVHSFKHDTKEYVKSGKLIEVLPDWAPESTPVSMLFPANKPIRPIVAELADLIERKWKSHPDLLDIEERGIH